jgi:hypothetical protein
MTALAAPPATLPTPQPTIAFYDLIKRDIRDPYYQQNFGNDGERFVAWYLRRVMLRDRITARDDITDGQNDKQMDAVIVDDDERRIVIVQGKFIGHRTVDSEPLREVLGAWALLQDLEALQAGCNDKLKQKLEAVRRGLEDEYRVDFELLTTGTLTSAAQGDMKAFSDRLEESDDFAASLHLVDTEVLQTRLAEAEAMELPSLDHAIVVEPTTTLVTNVGGRQIVVTMLPLTECLRLPGITDGRLFRKNVRQSLGSNNKVNRAMRGTILSDKVKDFFYYHNGVTALCDSMEVSADKKMLTVKGLSVVNGCQSISTINEASARVRSDAAKDAHVLFRLYEIPDRAFADRISVNTNSQSAVKPRDLRSNDKVMVGLKRAYESRYADGCLLTKRGEERPADRDANKTVDVAILAKMIMAWHCQRPNISSNEKKLFDEYYKTIFRTGYDPQNILALQSWLNAIEDAFPNLALNDVLKAGKSYVKYHLLFSVSAIIECVNKQTQAVIEPHYTMKASERASEILPLAANCLENALQNAINTAQMNNKIFSPQNWLKSIQSVQGQMLVAGTVAGMLPGMPNTATVLESMKAPLDAFHPRWSTD